MNGLALDSGEFISADELNAKWLPRKATEEEMSKEQPEALRLADALQAEFPGYEVADVSAAELRRLHAVEQELEALKRAISEAEPYGCVTVVRRLGHADEHNFYKYPSPPYLDNASECHALYTLKGIK